MIDLDRSRGHPVYLQILEQLERRIASGALPAGAALPSVRALSVELGINPNTVVRAYRELETRGAVVSVQGQGTFVAQDAPQARPAERLLAEHARRFARAARELGMDADDATRAVRAAWGEEDGDEQR